MQLLGNILYDSVYHTAPILLCVLGGIFAYKANVLNIALEGFMLSACFVSMLVTVLSGSLWLAYLAAVASCLLLWLIFSWLGVTYRGNVIIIGLAINMLVPAVAGFVLQYMGTANLTAPWLNVADMKLNIPLIGDIPLLGRILSGHPITTYVAFLMIPVMAVVMYRTKLGVYIRVVGENEDAAVSLGLNTNRYKYIAVLLGALCAALAGINLSLERMALFTNNMTAGRGFIAIAAIYCGRGSPTQSALYAIVFGIARSLAVNLGLFAGPAAALIDIVPYVLMTVVLTAVSILKRRNVQLRGFQGG